MKIIFMGTPYFAVPALQRLIEEKLDITGVYTKPPAPAGRGKKEQKSPIHELAEHHNLPIFTPISLKDEAEQRKFAELGADVALVAAYGLLLPEPILNGTKYGCINIHPSLLPRWRGAAPIQRTIIEGDKETGVCIMQMDKGLDTGDVLACEKYIMPPKITAGQLHDRMAGMGAELAIKVISQIPNLQPVKQPIDGIYAKKITKDDEKISWQSPAEKIECLVRGLQPRPGAYFIYKGERIKVIEAEVSSVNSGKPPGTVINDNLTIACGNGSVALKKLQRPGKNAMLVSDLLRGFEIKTGDILE